MEWIRQGWRYVTAVAPLLPIALACLAGAVWSVSAWWAVFILGSAFLVSRASWRWWLAIPLVAVVVAFRLEVQERPVRESLSKPVRTFVEGRLEVGRQVGLFTDERFGHFSDEDGTRKVFIPQAGRFTTGEVLEVKGRFFVPEAERNPGTFSRLDQWEREGISGGLVVMESTSLGLRWHGAPLRWAEQMRVGLREKISAGLPEESIGREVILAMVLGDKPPRDSVISQAFRESGAMHVFAVSGLHVTLVGGLCWLVLSGLPVPRRLGVVVVILAMVGYSMITGARPSSVRATMMAICFLGAFLVRRRPSLFNALALSFIIVVGLSPSEVFDIGFQLSYGVLASIGMGVGLVYRLTGKFAELDPFFPARLLTDWQRRRLSFRQYFASLAASSVAAWLGSLPMMIWHFGIVTPVAVLTSLVLIPLTMVILGCAFFSAFVGMFWTTGGEWVNQVNAGVGKAGYLAAEGFSDLPGGYWHSRELVAADWVVFDPADGGAASFLNVERGAMIDVGGRQFYHRELRSILSTWNADPEMVLISHPDGDHAGGLPDILERGGLKRALLPVSAALSPSYREFMAMAANEGCEILVPRTGERFELGDEVWLEIVREASGKEEGIADNRIMVMKVHWQGWKILVTGDLGLEDELKLLESGVDLSADVVIMGLHEWGVSGQKQFLDATGAKVVVVSGCRFLPEETPKPRWVSMVESAGIELLHQESTGAVLMNFTKGQLSVRSYLDPSKVIRLHK
ncbi:MAG: ComEC/Rec2 family competence protein [Akkermansiaceae bacterium]